MTAPWKTRRGLAVTGVLSVLGLAFAWVAMRAGPLAPIPVTVATVANAALEPAVYGIGTVESRYTHRVGPTAAGRVLRVNVDVGDRVRAGEVVADIDAVDLDARLSAQQATVARTQASVAAAEALVRDAAARAALARTQAARYEQLAKAGAASAETYDAKRQELEVAEAAVLSARAALDGSRNDLARARADVEALRKLGANLRLVAPAGGLVITRNADPGSTVVAGQPVVEIVDPAAVWISLRVDQLRAAGLRAGLPARITLRSRPGEALAGHVLRIEPVADSVTEELLAKVLFDAVPDPLPAIGELVEVTVALSPSEPAPVVAGASVHRVAGRLGVWTLDGGALAFAPVKTGATGLDGRVQIVEGLRGGERVVVYSQRALDPRSRVTVVDQLPGVGP